MQRRSGKKSFRKEKKSRADDRLFRGEEKDGKKSKPFFEEKKADWNKNEKKGDSYDENKRRHSPDKEYNKFRQKNESGKKTFLKKDQRKRPFRKDDLFERTSEPFDKKKGENRDKNDSKKTFSDDSPEKKREWKNNYERKPYYKKNYDKKPIEQKPTIESTTGQIRLNRYLANAGICSRREADALISSGAVSVNGKIVTEMGFRVSPTDRINYGGETLSREKMVYILLNKPKDYITTSDDPQKRKTVFELLKNACKERIYPVGRLDRSTTGVLLFTNDGDLTKRLTHPRYGIKKIYHVTLDKNLRQQDFEKIAEGVELEDGPIKVDEINYVGEGYTKKEIGIEIHSGRNRIVRRIFENFGYEIVKLDRVYFGGLTKKDLPKGRWKFLSEQEINMLKMTAK